MKYGYARVSTDGPSVDAQVREPAMAGCKGRARAKRRGVKLGRKPKQRREAVKRCEEDEETRAEIARRYNVHQSTISRLTA
jgi:DNA invertase Pin-like site-specific DNA recombinase